MRCANHHIIDGRCVSCGRLRPPRNCECGGHYEVYESMCFDHANDRIYTVLQCDQCGHFLEWPERREINE